MAAVAKSGSPSLATTLPCPAHTISGLLAGEAITIGDLCYVKSDGKIWKSDGDAANAAAKVDGIALQAAAAGEAVSLYFDVTVRYGAGMTPGARLYLSTDAGLISDSSTTGGTAPIGFVVDATRIRIWQSRY
jgi:hypothetical protein